MRSSTRSGLIPESFIETIIERSDIYNYVCQTVSLKNSNANSYKGLCPFHQEKTPSFHVHRDKQYFHCFGCGEHGNVINFLMKIRNLTFPDAVKLIAEDLNLPLPTEESSNNLPYKQAYEILAAYSASCQSSLAKNPACLKYLKERGLSEETIRAYQLGFTPTSINVEANELAQTLGIFNNYQKPYFRSRVIFPITNATGKIIGFGGRALDNSLPKYLNSKESFVFHKSKILYGLHQAKQTKPEYLIVVEGYMDVIALHEHGIKNAVATLGTAITALHITTLFKHTKKIAFCFDGDNAGQAAAWKTLLQAMPYMGDGYEMKFILLPEAEDPDSLISNHGKQAWKKIFQNGLELSEFFFKNLEAMYPRNTLEQKAKFASEAKKILAQMPNSICKQLMFDELEKRIGTTIVEKDNRNPIVKYELNDIDRALKLLIHNPKLAKDITLTDCITKSDNLLCKKLTNVLEFISLGGYDTMARLAESAKESDLYPIIEKYVVMPFDEIEESHLLIALTNILLRAELNIIHEKIKIYMANSGSINKDIQELLQRKSVIISHLNNQRELKDVL